jgi:aspartate/glutamate racemase
VERPRRIKTIGILGGMSDQATAEYYRMINQAVMIPIYSILVFYCVRLLKRAGIAKTGL